MTCLHPKNATRLSGAAAAGPLCGDVSSAAGSACLAAAVASDSWAMPRPNMPKLAAQQEWQQHCGEWGLGAHKVRQLFWCACRGELVALA